MASEMGPYPTGGSIEDVVLQALNPTGEEKTYFHTDNGQLWSELWQTVKQEVENDEMDEEEDEEKDMFEGRRIITTDNSYLGVCWVNVQPGDIVCCLAGGQVPFILRDMSKEKADKDFQLVAEAYVHSIMKGEAMEGLEMEDLSSFTLHQNLLLSRLLDSGFKAPAPS